jgi:hypothetical protein
MTRFAALVHPTKGVRFSPYAYVRSDSDVVVSRDEVPALFSSRRQYVWGYSDGSGEPLRFTFEDYYGRYVYNADFLNAPRVEYNSPPIRAGNTPSNITKVYPAAMFVEHHFPGFDPKYEGMDWSSLWLVFEQVDAAWFLVGVVHGSWTI